MIVFTTFRNFRNFFGSPTWLAFRKVEILDIRALEGQLDKNIIFKKIDIINLPKSYLNKYQSVSCLHTIEHVGLGRYGDRIDVNGHLKALKNILRLACSEEIGQDIESISIPPITAGFKNGPKYLATNTPKKLKNM